MKLATYGYDDGVGPGRIEGGSVVDLRPLAATLVDLLDRLAEANDFRGSAVPFDRSRLLAPVPEPRRFLGVGLNYRDHARETGRALGAQPAWFAKLPGAVAGPYADIPCPARLDTLDYEGELGLVIGRRCRNVAPDDVPAFVAGLVVVNDITERALARPDTLLLAKGQPGFGPFGPWLTTLDETGDPHRLAIRTTVNGVLRQDSSTAEMHRNCWDLVSLASTYFTLEPGDVITTGSPAGSGVGFDPPLWLRPGDSVRVEIEGLGFIENRIIADP
jgi:2-keto-4-pentenoate hydratase/2-oxohepta-3-ene-1,7-dioic acid hydratase in catechol pathway